MLFCRRQAVHREHTIRAPCSRPIDNFGKDRIPVWRIRFANMQ